MHFRRPRKPSTPPTVYVGDYTHRLTRIRSLPHDDDERQRREDHDYGKSLFTTPPVPLPRFLTRQRRKS